jgi:mRNA degradation ribonuclease J1/J2
LQISTTLRTWIERVRTFYRIAKENGRRLVVKLKNCCCYYYYLKYMSQDGKLGVPNYYDDKDIVIYNKPKQVSGTYAQTATILRRERDVCKPAQCKDGG